MSVRVAGLLAGLFLCVTGGAALGQPPGAVQMPAPAKLPAIGQTGTDTAPQAPQAPQEITARSWPDRTAMWVGDRVLYTVEFECAPTVDILSTDLASEKLGLTGLEVVDSSSERVLAATGRLTYRFQYRLTTYETGTKPLKIADLMVRYGKRRAGQRLEEAAPAGEIKVDGAALVLRSTIPEDVATVNARDRRPLISVPMLLKLAKPIGIGLILVSVAPVFVWAGTLFRRTRPKVKRRDTRAARSQTRAALEQLGPADTSSEAARREAYTRLDAVVREHLSNVSGLPAMALTPTEISQRLAKTSSSLPLETVSAVLGECERARYGPLSLLPAADRFREAVVSAERIIAVSR